MSRITCLTGIFVVLLEALAIAACTGSDAPLTPAPTDTPANILEAPGACPTFEQACHDIGEAMFEACPPDGDYPNHGQYVSCRNRVLNSRLNELTACFTLEELNALRTCARSWADGQNDPGDPASEPVPPEKPEDRTLRFHRE